MFRSFNHPQGQYNPQNTIHVFTLKVTILLITIQVGFVLCQGDIPVKCCANGTQNSHLKQSTKYVQKVMRLIFFGQAKGSGSGVSGPDSWSGMSGKRSDPAQLPLSLYRLWIACEVDSCLSVVSRVKMQRSVNQ